MNDVVAAAEVFADGEVYGELKRLARRQLARRPAGDTLCTTALVHEACLKLSDADGEPLRARAHWLNLAAMAMRQVLCDHARARLRRHRVLESMPPDQLAALAVADQTACRQAERLLAIDALLVELAERWPQRAFIASARYYAGLSEAETAAAGALPLRTVQREWARTREWLKLRLRHDER